MWQHAGSPSKFSLRKATVSLNRISHCRVVTLVFNRLTRGFLCDLPLTRSLPLLLSAKALRIVMLVSKATIQDLSPGRVDRCWMKKHESVAALANCLYFLLNRSSRKLKCESQSQKVTPEHKLFCYFIRSWEKKIAWCNISHCKWMKQAVLKQAGFAAVPLEEEEERIKFIFSKVGTDWVSPINVKRQIRELYERGGLKNKSQQANAKKQILPSVV